MTGNESRKALPEPADHYGDPAAEQRSLVDGAGLFVCHRTQVELSGDDRAAFLHNLTTGEIRKLPAGQGAEVFLLDARGHLHFHVYVFAGETSHVLETVAGQAAPLVLHLDRYLIRERVEIADRSNEWGELLIGGPQAAACLAATLSSDPPSERLHHISAAFEDVPIRVRAVDLIRPAAWLVSAPRDQLPRLWTALVARGATSCGRAAYEAARIEAGFPHFGIDASDKNLPQELGRDAQAISFTKGCYIGQETVARIDALGHVNRKLVGLVCDDTNPPVSGTALSVGDQLVGHVTSGAWSERLRRSVALAYVRREHVAVGSRLESASGAAEVVPLPMP